MSIFSNNKKQHIYSEAVKQCGMAGTCALKVIENCVECNTDLCNADFTTTTAQTTIEPHGNGGMMSSVPPVAVWLLVGSKFRKLMDIFNYVQ